MANVSNDKLAETIGLPDAQDKLRIQRWLMSYEKKNPGVIQFHRDAARARLKDPVYGVIDKLDTDKSVGGKSSNRRYLFELPEEFGIWMGQAYPLMFKAREHTRWFVKNFPELLIPEKH